jgi:hypothetical protein
MKFNPQPKPLKRTKSKQDNIKPVAEKKVTDKVKYNKDSKAWIKGKRCACGCGECASLVHHMRGREGYASDKKYFAGIKLLFDKEHWLACCFNCHVEIHNNPEFAYKEGYLDSRSGNIYR